MQLTKKWRLLFAVIGTLTTTVAVSGNVQREERVQFGRGQVVTLRLTSEPSEWLIGTQALATQYDDLARVARAGNSVVAENLSEAIGQCEAAYESPMDLEAALVLIREKRLLRLRGYPPVQIPDEANAEDVAHDMLVTPFEFCSGLTGEQRASAKEWQAIAVNFGNADAAAAALDTERDSSRRQELFDILWAHGDPEALRAKALYYEGLFKQGGVPEDAIQAFAHMYAMNEFAKFSARISIPGPIRKRYHDGIASDLKRIGETLTADQRVTGVEIAADLIRSNPACCWAL